MKTDAREDKNAFPKEKKETFCADEVFTVALLIVYALYFKLQSTLLSASESLS